MFVVVDGRYDGEVVSENGEIEILGFSRRTGNDSSVLGLEGGVSVIHIVPGFDRRIIVSVVTSVQIHAIRIIREDLPFPDLRGKILLAVFVI